MRSFAVAVTIATLALSACGDSRDAADPQPAVDPAVLLAQSARTAREQATFSFAAEYTRTRADRPDSSETYGNADGVIDLGSGRGRMTIEFDLGLPALDEPIRLRWDASAFEARVGGETRRSTRSEARVAGGLIGRLPDEPEALVELMEAGREARIAGEDEVDGARVTRVAFTAPTTLGAPAELTAGDKAPIGPRMPAEAWIDPDGRPRRLSFSLRLPATEALPARTVVAVYDLADFGEPYRG